VIRRPCWPLLALAIGFLHSPLAQACPYCLGKDATLPPTLKLVGLFLLIPFAIVATVATIARRLR
jgi:hypothetical protein